MREKKKWRETLPLYLLQEHLFSLAFDLVKRRGELLLFPVIHQLKAGNTFCHSVKGSNEIIFDLMSLVVQDIIQQLYIGEKRYEVIPGLLCMGSESLTEIMCFSNIQQFMRF